MASVDVYHTSQGKMFRARVRRNGQTHTQVFATRSEANQWARAQEGLVLAGMATPLVKKASHTLGEAFDRYREEVLPYKKYNTRRPQSYQIPRLLTFFGKTTPLSDITSARIRAFLLSLKEEGIAPATQVRYLALLSHLFSIAIKEWEWMHTNPCRFITKPREPKGRERYLSAEEIQRLLTACEKSRNPHLYLIALLAISTGARYGEVLNLRWVDCQTHRAPTLTFRDTKNHETRCVPLVGTALEVLQAYEHSYSHQPTDLLFPSQKNPQKPRSFRKTWQRALAEANIEGAVFHSLRHTCGSQLAMSGASLLDIATLLGHRSLEMVKRYSHLSQGHLSQTLERMTSAVLP